MVNNMMKYLINFYNLKMKDLKSRRPNRNRKTECHVCLKLVRNNEMEAHRAKHARQKLNGCTFKLNPKDRNWQWLCGRCGQTMTYRRKARHLLTCSEESEKTRAEIIRKYFGPMAAQPQLHGDSSDEELKVEEAPDEVQPLLAIKEEADTEPAAQSLDSSILEIKPCCEHPFSMCESTTCARRFFNRERLLDIINHYPKPIARDLRRQLDPDLSQSSSESQRLAEERDPFATPSPSSEQESVRSDS